MPDVGTRAAEPELQRLREELYRRSPSPGAVERYTAMLERSGTPVVPPPEEAHPPAPGRRRRRWPLALAGAAAIAALAVGGTAALAPPARASDAAETLTTAGPYAVTDRAALDSLARPGASDSRLITRAVQNSELPQLAVWDARRPGVWVQQGRGGLQRRFDEERPPAARAWPHSIVVQCTGSGRYRWTITGTTRQRPAVHVLETATGPCGAPPTVATSTRPAGAVVRGFDFTVGSASRWGMAFVYPLDLD